MRMFRWSGVTAWLAVAVILACLCMTTCAARGQCAGGTCPAPVWRPASPRIESQTAPTWRYAQAVGHRRAVVRIETTDGVVGGGQSKSLGSGVLIRWRRRIVVVTAAHVIRSAKQVFVWLATGKRYQARVLTVDSAWDCAVLDIGCPSDLDVEPADVETGDGAHPGSNDRLETCGYGGDGRLACNYGSFSGYRGRVGGGPSDWMAISGHNRNGDSGGPVFNARGRVIGIMWGSNGTHVMAVQPGRLHAVLNRAVPQGSLVQAQKPVASQPPSNATTPTGPLGILPICRRPQPVPTPAPAPPVIVRPDPTIGPKLDSIDRKIDQVIRNTELPPAVVEVLPPTPEPVPAGVNPLVGGLIMLVCVILGFVVYFSAQKG